MKKNFISKNQSVRMSTTNQYFKKFEGTIQNVLPSAASVGNIYTFLAGAGISVDAPSSLDSAREIEKGILGFLAPKDEVDTLLSIRSLRFESVIELLHRHIDHNLEFLDYFGLCRIPNLNHLLLAKAITVGNHVMTTNFDNLIEHALIKIIKEANGKQDAILPIITKSDYEKYKTPTDLIKEGKFPLYKIHGSKKNIITNENTQSSVITTISDIGKSKEKNKTFSIEEFKKPALINLTKERILVIIGYSGSDDFDIAPMLKELSHVKYIVWIEHSSSSSIEITKSSDKIWSLRDDLLQLDRLLCEIKLLANCDVYRVKANTKQFIIDYLWNALLNEPIPSQILSSQNASEQTPPFKEWIRGKFEEVPEIVKCKYAGDLYFELGQFDEVIRCAEKGEKLAYAGGLETMQAEFLNQLGITYYRKVNLDKALEYYMASLKLAEKINNPFLLGIRLNNIGLVHIDKKEYDKALAYLQKALDIAKKLGDHGQIASRLNNIGLVYMFKDDFDKALGLYNEALTLNNKIGNLLQKKNCLNNIGDLYERWGKLGQAMSFYQDALRIAEEIGDINGVATLLKSMGEAYSKMGDIGKAMERLKKAQQIFEELNIEVQIEETKKLLAEVKKQLHP